MKFFFFVIISLFLTNPGNAQVPSSAPFNERLLRPVSLDARGLNIIDVIKNLAQKGDFNVVVSPSVSGKITVFLQGTTLKDALDTIAGMNQLAYYTDKDILQVMTASEYESMFGKRFNDKTVVSVVHLQYSKPAFVLAALANVKSNVGKITIDEDTGSMVLEDTPEGIERMKSAIAQIERPLAERSYELKYARAEKVVEKLRPRIDAKAVGSITADVRSNRVLVRVFPGRLDEVMKMVRALDKPTRQVLIEARILQVTLTPEYNQGIDWTAFLKNDGKTKFNIQTMLANSAIGSNFGQIGVGAVGAGDFALALRGLNQISESKTLAFPKIVVANGEAAKIHVGDTIPYIVTTRTGTGDDAFQSEIPRFIDVGLSLDVIPTISENGMVTMRIKPVIASVVATLASNEGGIPQVNRTEVETSMMVRDGMTIVMAGLIKHEKHHIKKGVPGLMNVPYLGMLFSQRSDTVISTETVILITPHIITGKEPASKVEGTIKSAKTY